MNEQGKYSGLPDLKVSYADVLTRPLFYPENDFAQKLAVLMRRKTFTKKEVDFLREIGFNVEVSVRRIEVPDNLR